MGRSLETLGEIFELFDKQMINAYINSPYR